MIQALSPTRERSNEALRTMNEIAQQKQDIKQTANYLPEQQIISLV